MQKEHDKISTGFEWPDIQVIGYGRRPVTSLLVGLQIAIGRQIHIAEFNTCFQCHSLLRMSEAVDVFVLCMKHMK